MAKISVVIRIREWYSGIVLYSMKNMATQSSSAIRGVTELSMAIEDFYGATNIPLRLYMYSNSGGDKKTPTLRFRKL